MNCALASRPGRSTTSSACWAAQVCSFLHFMSPIVDGVPQRIDTAVVIAHLQRRTYDAVNDSDLRKVREWLGVRGPVNCDNYQMAGYLQAVASKTGRRRLAQFRMGSHMLGVETGRWQRLPRAERICQRCSCGVVDDEEGRKAYMYALTKPHGSCRGPSGSDIDIDIDYILVVGHFGLATGSGGETQSNMHVQRVVSK